MTKRRLIQLTSLILGLLRFPFYSSKFEIKKGYRHRKTYTHFDGRQAKDEAQKEVYELAADFASKNSVSRILDVGCGSGYKMSHILGEEFQVEGTEIGTTLDFLSRRYPDYTFYDSEKDDYSGLKADLVVCSDVIEHVVNPDQLLTKIRSVQDLKYIVLSTPDRLLARGWFDFGPPHNPTHVREWTGKEFARFVSGQGF